MDSTTTTNDDAKAGAVATDNNNNNNDIDNTGEDWVRAELEPATDSVNSFSIAGGDNDDDIIWIMACFTIANSPPTTRR